MSKLNELIQFADHLNQRKIQDRRYQDTRNMQLAQIAEKKNNELNIVKSQQFLNDAVKQFSQSGWGEDGVYKDPGVDKGKILDNYLSNMGSIGQAGDRFMIDQSLSQVGDKYLKADTVKLQGKIAAWEAANADKKDDWVNNTYKEDKAAYIKSIGGQELWTKAFNLSGGVAGAMEATGLSPETFAKKDEGPLEWMRNNKLATATGLVTGGAAIWGTVSAMRKSIATGEALKAGKDGAIKEVSKLTAELNALKASQPSKEVLSNISKMEKYLKIIEKKGYFDASQWKVLDKLKAGIPKGAADVSKKIKVGQTALDAAEEALKGIKRPTMTSTALSDARSTTGGLIMAAKNLFTGDKGSVVKALKSSGYAKYGLGMVAGGATASKIAEWMGADEGTQGLASTGGSIAGTITAPKVMKAMTSPAFLKLLAKHAPKIATKLAISAAGYVGPQAAEPISTALGLAGSAWAAYDIYQLTKSIPELAAYFSE